MKKLLIAAAALAALVSPALAADWWHMRPKRPKPRPSALRGPFVRKRRRAPQ